jgi:hypothetical protein
LVSNIKGGHRLRVFENRVLGRILGLKRDEVTGGWRKLVPFAKCNKNVQARDGAMGRACSTNWGEEECI